VSFRLRLALSYGALTGALILVVSLVAYAVHGRASYDHADQALMGATEYVAGLYAVHGSFEEIRQLLVGPAVSGVAVLIYRPTGEIMLASPNAAEVPALDARAVLLERYQPPFDRIVGLVPPWGGGMVLASGALSLVADADGGRWRVYAEPLNEAEGYVLVAASPLSNIDRSLQDFRVFVALSTVASVLLTPLVGWLLAGGILGPVAKVTETAAAIARSRQLGDRVPITHSRDELDRLAAAFNEMLASLEEAHVAQQRFVADASHELRAPLTAIQANLELLERQRQMPPSEQQEAVAEALREARRLTRLVADLLTLARADAGQVPRRERLELDRLLVEVTGEARHLARGQRVQIEHMEPALVQGDPDRLKQLLLVLLDNALKYTPPDGQVAVALRRNARSAEITIRDTGGGISAQDLPHVFERFYRGDRSRTRDPGGTGLGLPIAHWIAEQHGGEVTLTSRPGSGTVATVRLPLVA